MPPDPVAAMPAKALMTPTTVPSRPTNGAVVPMVARELTPFLQFHAVVLNLHANLRDPQSAGRKDVPISDSGVQIKISSSGAERGEAVRHRPEDGVQGDQDRQAVITEQGVPQEPGPE